MITLSAKDLQVKYERQVALSIDELSVSGTVLAVLGHNGAGKSTLLKTLLGLLAPRRGSLLAKDSKATQLIPEQHMAFCPENGAVFEDIRVSDYLRVWLRLRGKHDSLKAQRVTQLLDLFEVGPLLEKFGRELSKGQRRRVQSVVGFLIEPKLFLFDEPFDGLDVQRTAELAGILEIYKEQTAFIISSHRMDVIERVADAAIVLANGAVVAKGEIPEVATQLAGKSIFFNKAVVSKEFSREIAQQFALYITHIGDQFVLTGPAVSDPVFKDFLLAKNLIMTESREFIPTLTDAMGFHLEKLRSQSVQLKQTL